MKRTVADILSLFLLLFPAVSSAQDTYRQYDDNRTYLESAREKSMLFRGLLAPEYRFQYNGNCYVAGKDFLPGRVMYNGRLYDGVYLNIDACRQVLEVKDNLIFATDADHVEYACIGDSKYVNLSFGGRVGNAPAGFLRADYEGEYSFYTLVRKTLSSDSEYHNGDDIGYYDPDYKVSVQSGGRDVRVNMYFACSMKYYMVVDGVAEQVKSRSAFLRHFDRPTAKAMRRYAALTHLDETDVRLDVYAKTLLAYRDGQMKSGGEDVR